MIDTIETGQKKLNELQKSSSGTNWTQFEEEFLERIKNRPYSTLTPKQQNLVGQLYEKMTQ